ncbi:MAG: hypothetical protein M1839_005519 [Geoglossum umbratile]|nr:MAG: hypothetical protein M1839_005519 [Geoglossum umbratile]
MLQCSTATCRSERAGTGTHSQRKRTNLLTPATTAIAKKACRYAPIPTHLPLPLLIQEEPTERDVEEEELDEEAQDQEDRDGEEEEARGQEDEDDEEKEAQGQEDEDDEAEEAPQIPTWLGS